ncbi:MAG: hypothetical protein ACXWUU_04455 [Burkholderiales bacterium]
MLRRKFEAALGRRFPEQQRRRILNVCDDPQTLDRMPVNEFVQLFVADTPR